MPEISWFYGIKIMMFFVDHARPHFHVEYAGEEATYQISPLTQIKGYVHPRVNRMVTQWAREHQKDLLADWDLAVAGKEPVRIPGLG